jgi:cell division transport system ATP-binding protein
MKISNLTLTFGNKIVLKEINLSINSWEFIFFIWHSGSWKTTLIRSLIGDKDPLSWDIILDSWIALYKNMNEEVLQEYRRNIWVIFQDYKLLESKSIYENVAFAMEVCGYSDEIIRRKVPEALEQVGLLVKKDRFAYEISGWEKQRISIARALVHDPDIIIWDEPTGNLDPETAEWIMKIFNDLNKEWKTIIIATHDKNIVNSMKKRVVAFKDKEVISDENKWKYIF